MPDSLHEVTLDDINVEAEKARAEMDEKLNGYLNDKYGQKFIMTTKIISPGDASVIVFFHPEQSPEINFTLKMGQDGEIHDDYIRNLLLGDLRLALMNAIPGSSVCVSIPEDTDLQETDVHLSLKEYLQKRDIHRILVRILINMEDSVEKEVIIHALENASTFFGVDLPAGIWMINGEEFEFGKKLFNSYPSVSETLIRDLQPVSAFSVYVVNGSVARMQAIDLHQAEVVHHG